MLLLFWVVSLSFADEPPSLSISLDREIEDQQLAALQGLNENQKEMILRSFDKTLFASARIHYELGLQYNQQGNTSMAEQQYRRSLSIDELYTPALYDLAEILLLRGESTEAKEHLLAIQQQQEQHWVVSYRLSQIAATEQNTALMEYNLKRALREGMPSQVLVDDKMQWQALLSNRTVALSMELLLSALGYDSIWTAMQSAQ